MEIDKQNINSSFRCIFNISIPLILSCLSTNLMYVADRFMLAGYSIDSMNASVISGNFTAIFTWILVGIATSSEVYVGQYNGSKQFDKLSSPIWQMIYMSLISAFIFVPIGYYSEYINLLPEHCYQEGVNYQRPLFYFGFLPSLIAGISAFFIGLGKTKTVTITVVIGNAINIILDYIFIYDFNMGCTGAATGTVISEIIQVLILASIFFNKNNRDKFQTLKNRSLNKELLLGCLKIGLPVSASTFLWVVAWYLIYLLVGYTSRELVTVLGMCMNIWILFAFIGEGLSKSIAAISSNLIGKKDLESIKIVFKKFVVIAISASVLLAIPLCFFPEIVFNLLDLLKEDISGKHMEIKAIFQLTLVDIFLEILLMVIWGVLLSGGDTKYPTVVNQIGLWLIVVLPTTFMYYMNSITSVNIIFVLIGVCYALNVYFLYRRYKSLKWYNLLVK